MIAIGRKLFAPDKPSVQNASPIQTTDLFHGVIDDGTFEGCPQAGFGPLVIRWQRGGLAACCHEVRTKIGVFLHALSHLAASFE